MNPGNIIEQKVNAFTALSGSPSLLFLFCAMLVLLSAAFIVMGIIIKNPNMINNIINKKNNHKLLSKKNRSLKEKIDNIEDLFIKDREERLIRQNEVNDKFITLENMINDVAAIAKDTAITAGLNAINNDNLLTTEVIHEALKLYSKGCNGGSVDRMITVLMRDDNGKKIWKSEVSHYEREHGKQSDHFYKCVDEISKRTGW